MTVIISHYKLNMQVEIIGRYLQYCQYLKIYIDHFVNSVLVQLIFHRIYLILIKMPVNTYLLKNLCVVNRSNIRTVKIHNKLFIHNVH